ncbi:MAG: OmpH family outer membrane protein [Pseudomonadota bacterium]
MLKKFLIIISLFINTVALAADNNVAVLNTDRLKNDTKAGQSIAKQVEDLQAKFRDKVSKLTQEFDTKKIELDKNKPILSKEAFAKKEAEFNNKMTEVRKDLQQEASKIDQMQQMAVADFNTIARSVIDDVVKQGKYSHVFPAEVVIYADPKSDITSQVIAGVDKKTDRIELKEPAKDKK